MRKRRPKEETGPKILKAAPVGYSIEIRDNKAIWTYTGELKGHVSDVRESSTGRKFFIVPTRRIYLEDCEEV